MKFFLLVFCLVLFGCGQVELQPEMKSVQPESIESVDFDYVNNRFAFALNLRKDFKIQYLDDEAGIVMTKWKPYVDVPGRYKVEVVILPFENAWSYGDISQYVAEQYSGYEIEFRDYGKFSGYYVNEGLGNDAVRHFFTFGGRDDVIFEIYMRIPSVYYAEHLEFFEEFVGGVEFF